VTDTVEANRGRGNRGKPPQSGLFLEWLAAFVLLLVAFALGWMILVAYRPDWLRLGSLENEVVALVGLLSVALILVSVVALRNTRD
jgi:hypothetical protein